MIRALSRRARLAGLLVAFAYAAAAPALAHAELTAMEPAADAIVAEAPERIALEFSEPVEARFSTFLVVPLADATETPPAGPDFEALHELAVERTPGLLDDPEEAPSRVEVEVVAGDAAEREVVLAPQNALAPGAYLVAWRALSVDGHAADGHAVFVIAGGED